VHKESQQSTCKQGKSKQKQVLPISPNTRYPSPRTEH
jgi:hypothetical protein